MSKFQARPNAIWARRKQLGIRLAQLAEAIGVTVPTAWRIEQGLHCVYHERARLICDALDVRGIGRMFVEAPPWGQRGSRSKRTLVRK